MTASPVIEPGARTAPEPPARLPRVHGGRDPLGAWPLADRIGYALCWLVGIALCAVALWLVGYLAVKGISTLSPKLLIEHPNASTDQRASGGLLDPIEGTFMLLGVAIALALPVGVALALWLVEYGKPRWLARALEPAIELIAGMPDVLLAMSGLVLFARPALAFLSSSSAGGAVSGKSFLTAGSVLALVAAPMIFAATRDALNQLPSHLREASLALGKTRAYTIRRILLPAIRPGIARGVTLGAGRVIGDTAIVVFLLGATLHLFAAGGPPVLSTLRGEGTTLTSYILYNSPAGEGHAYQKAFAAAFLLLTMVLALNFLAAVIGSGGRGRGPRRARVMMPRGQRS